MKSRRIEPGAGRESVWDYPRPPRVEPCRRHLEVVFGGIVVAETTHALRVLETSQPPAYYIPPGDVRWEYFTASAHTTACEFKGVARYWTIRVARRAAVDAAWSYPDPAAGYEAIRDHIAVYPGRVDACMLDGERAQPQEGAFYGGWITREIVGPFKGGPGTEGW